MTLAGYLALVSAGVQIPARRQHLLPPACEQHLRTCVRSKLPVLDCWLVCCVMCCSHAQGAAGLDRLPERDEDAQPTARPGVHLACCKRCCVCFQEHHSCRLMHNSSISRSAPCSGLCKYCYGILGHHTCTSKRCFGLLACSGVDSCTGYIFWLTSRSPVIHALSCCCQVQWLEP
jgi:hypothetical protein